LPGVIQVQAIGLPVIICAVRIENILRGVGEKNAIAGIGTCIIPGQGVKLRIINEDAIQ
jgi:hypothetical protein